MVDQLSSFGNPLPAEEFRVLNGLRHRLLIWDPPSRATGFGGREPTSKESKESTGSQEEPGAPTLVLLHGFLDLSWSFTPFVAALRRLVWESSTASGGSNGSRDSGGLSSLRIIAPDLRGHGATEWVGRGGYYHFPDYVADMLPLIESLPRPRYLLGHSMGGTVSSLLAGAFPDAIDKLVLVEGLGPPSIQEDEVERMQRWIHDLRLRNESPPRSMKDLDDASRRLLRANSRLSPTLAALLAEKGTRKVDGGLVWAFDPMHRTRSPLGYTPESFRRFLAHITAPTLVVEGAESGFKHDVGDDRVTAIAHRREARIENAGHMVHQDQPEALAGAVVNFLIE